ncbi:GNAT family N-acetyltransferase [Texcoconibacillus texcoconensis]|uniref:GNAT superfamily N-acetyltransferase n=1 Tax=Texcoconibacillus texcoconensis TaxID=1095777 RepID=A0A840QSI1_9BACI|nr:GNAT family N-acetyltransferase [Texcoconibacillus texcoconensis]MBB5174325.1 GNAT superfamily N-acetyltransferase [Texcoconibacillus texcoconensis]
MEILKVPDEANHELIQGITELMMEQMDSLSVEMSAETLYETISISLQPHTPSAIFVAQRDAEIVGCAFANSGISLEKAGYYIWLNDLYVKQSKRQQGIAKKLLLYILYWAEESGYKGIELETGINDIATKKLYNSLGFYDIVSKRYGRIV